MVSKSYKFYFSLENSICKVGNLNTIIFFIVTFLVISITLAVSYNVWPVE